MGSPINRGPRSNVGRAPPAEDSVLPVTGYSTSSSVDTRAPQSCRPYQNVRGTATRGPFGSCRASQHPLSSWHWSGNATRASSTLFRTATVRPPRHHLGTGSLTGRLNTGTLRRWASIPQLGDRYRLPRIVRGERTRERADRGAKPNPALQLTGGTVLQATSMFHCPLTPSHRSCAARS